MISITLQELHDAAQESLHDVVDDYEDTLLHCYGPYLRPDLDEDVEEDR